MLSLGSTLEFCLHWISHKSNMHTIFFLSPFFLYSSTKVIFQLAVICLQSLKKSETSHKIKNERRMEVETWIFFVVSFKEVFINKTGLDYWGIIVSSWLCFVLVIHFKWIILNTNKCYFIEYYYLSSFSSLNIKKRSTYSGSVCKCASTSSFSRSIQQP